MRKIIQALIIFIFLIAPAYGNFLETEILLLLTGPVSEAVQETVLLIRRGDNFISTDSLLIGCIAGASSGMMVSLAPTLGFTMTGIAVPVSIGYVVATSILSCGMTVVSSATGMFTSKVLEQARAFAKEK